ncbi:5'-3' exoribonuclease 2 [Ordospora colligata]|uniref:5'-3' exonuclease n=1 Tax=Ordospora colligata OC4 TaxID=1354746 RepID=A0A0B2UJ03_9MICR|nr:5'-3' exonuclease [Ordospora colligata OC4]KHN69037.1 5'-3' exonuclease [Ordospora colligata OC4]TBU14318.1 5'-3' exonuclease [Ordospora colligata]TBU14383.1 5'-3' exonuclease [Ordospora colligata]
MGVPSLFRWLQLSHRESIHNISEKPSVDCLYLDFNAIIHTCIKPGIGSYDEIEKDLHSTVGDFIDHMLNKVRPKKLLYIAIDGVAPRAKLSHQRARRYKSALGKKDGGVIIPAIKANLIPTAMQKVKKGDIADEEFTGESSLYDKFVAEELSDESSETGIFDLNCITPGTEFMERLHAVLISYIQHKLSNDIEWLNINIIYSSYLVPGEGEQKIMNFIRAQDVDSKKDVHMIYSPDGDLIFLGLSLYHNKVLIMRDHFSPNKERSKRMCSRCGRTGHNDDECGVFTNYNFVYVNILELRIRIIKEFKRQISHRFDEESMLNDWIFLCFLLGNDFVPSLPCLEIRFHSIETLSEVLVKNFAETKAYITSNGPINYPILRNFYRILSKREDDLYYRKSQSLDRFREEIKIVPDVPYEKIPIHTKAGKIQYYSSKLNAHTEADIRNACYEYIKGLTWIYSYYIFGYTGWDWYYPYHFAPLATDLAKVFVEDISIPPGIPLRPIEQLLVVLPPMSKDMVPNSLQFVYEKYKEHYPKDVKTDMFDKVHAWQEIVVLPFVDFGSILSENSLVFNTLPYEDLSRNIRGTDLIFLKEAKAVDTIMGMYMGLKPSCFIKSRGYSGTVTPYAFASFPGDHLQYNGNSFVNKVVVSSIETNHSKSRN